MTAWRRSICVQIARVVLDPAGLEPGPEAAVEELVVERHRPQPRVVLAEARQRAGHAQHADQARPRALEIGQQQNRPAMLREARRQVMRVLPGGQQHDDRRLRIDAGEHVAALALVADEAVAAIGLERMRPLRAIAEAGDQHLRQPRLELLLHRPALDVGRLAQIGVGDEQHLVLRHGERRADVGERQGQHALPFLDIRQCQRAIVLRQRC